MIKLRSLTNLGTACPSQWTGSTEEGEDVYVRFRWGYLTVEIGGDMTYQKQVSDGLDGVMNTARMLQLTEMEFTRGSPPGGDFRP